VGGRNNCHGIRLADCINTRITDCTFDGVSGDNVFATGSRHLITGNTFTSVADQGTGGFSGIHTEYGATSIVIANNALDSSETNARTRSFIREENVGNPINNVIVGNVFTIRGTLTTGLLERAGNNGTVIRDNIGVANSGIEINAQTGTTYTFALADAGKLVTLSNAAAITATVPPNSTTPFPIGTVIKVQWLGVGQPTIAAGAGVTVSAAVGLKLADRYAGADLIKTGTDAWWLTGRLAA
jgi:alpha-D-ribose 1-methylphosphonate 5-triphosphate synthase subunit PhnH